MKKRALAFVCDSNCQSYLDFMALQLAGCAYDAFVITRGAVKVPPRFVGIVGDEVAVKMGFGEACPVHPHLTNAFLKMHIPFAPELAGYEEVLYMDLDVELKPGWEGAFDHVGSKVITACRDVGVGPGSNMVVFKYYGDRPFSYANSGVLLFDMSRKHEFPDLERTAWWIREAYEKRFNYPDQCAFNGMGVVDCSLPMEYNCFRRMVRFVPGAKIVHYTAEIGAKEDFNRMVDAALARENLRGF